MAIVTCSLPCGLVLNEFMNGQPRAAGEQIVRLKAGRNEVTAEQAEFVARWKAYFADAPIGKTVVFVEGDPTPQPASEPLTPPEP